MAKAKTFKWTSDGPGVVHVAGHSNYSFEPGKTRTVETDDPVVIAAFSSNPDLEEVKQNKKG